MRLSGENGKKVAVAAGPWQPLVAAAAGKLGGEPPTEILLLPNPWILADMTLVVDDAARKSILDEFKRRKIDLVIDYEHQTLEAGPAPASGWIRDLRGDKDGLWATKIDWTEKAAGFIRAGEYRYFSPVAFFDEASGRVVSLHSVALTNTPRTNKQTPLTARAAASLIEKFQKGREEGMKKWIQILATLLKKAATSKPSDLLADAKQFVAQLEAEGAEPAATEGEATIAASLGYATAGATDVPEEVATLLGLEKGAPIAKVKATILTLQHPADMVAKSEHDKVVAKLKDAEQKIDASTKTSKVDQLVAKYRNRITPAMEPKVRKIAAKSLEDAEDMVKELPVQVNAGAAVANSRPDAGAAQGDEDNVIVTVGDGEMRLAEANSASVAAATKAIMKEKNISYADANEIRKQREALAEIEV